LGGSAIGGELMAMFAANSAPLPIQVVRGYDLPAYIQGKDTLVIASSFSGTTEETLAVYDIAQQRGCQILGMTTGGTLAELCRANGHSLWQFEDTIGQPRAAIGWSLGLMLGLANRLGWVNISDEEFADAIENLRKYRVRYRVDSLAKDNPAKRQAGQYLGRIPVIIGSGVFEVVARRWKGQLNENAKFWAMFDGLPEMNHNSVVGIHFPKEQMTKLSVVFIASREYDHARVALRHTLTFKLLLQQGIMVDKFRPRGKTFLAQMFHAIFYGDYVSFYAALANGVDPSTIAPIIELKNALANPNPTEIEKEM
jgi:glucose/mannose-6-phosphate isomerase